MRRLPLLPAPRLSCLVAALLLGTVPLSAQGARPDSAVTPTAGTVLHTVRRGDTLYDIARTYLGNPRKWPELFRANAGQIANPHWIYPGQRLVMGADGKPVFAPPSGVAAAPVEEAAAEVLPGSSRPVVMGAVGAPQSQSALQNATISGRALRPTIREGEVSAAPFLVPSRARRAAGELVSRADRTVLPSATLRDQFQIYDDANVLVPPGATPTPGARYGVFRAGPEIDVGGQRRRVMQPTGVVEIVAAGTGRAAKARVVSMFASLRRGDELLPLDVSTAPATVRPEPVANGPLYEVAFIAGGVVLPTVQHYVLIALPKGGTAQVGDQFALVDDGARLTPSGKDVAPPAEIAQASVVKVTPEGATAIIVGHDQPAVRAGMKARLIARMP